MIKISIYRNNNKKIFGFVVNNHGDPIVCSAISALTVNAVNSVEAFTDEVAECEYDNDGGYLKFIMPNIKDDKENDKVSLLMDSLVLGLSYIENDYKKYVRIKDNNFEKEV